MHRFDINKITHIARFYFFQAEHHKKIILAKDRFSNEIKMLGKKVFLSSQREFVYLVSERTNPKYKNNSFHYTSETALRL